MCAPPCPPPASARRAVVARTYIPCDHTRRTALLLIGAPLVSGFASMAGCTDHDNAIQALEVPGFADLPGVPCSSCRGLLRGWGRPGRALRDPEPSVWRTPEVFSEARIRAMS